MQTTKACVFQPESSATEPSEVGLSHFAAICGLTEREFVQRMCKKIEEGNLLRLLKDDSCEDVVVWALDNRMRKPDQDTVVVFRLSQNRQRDVALFCLASLDNLPTIQMRVKKMFPGFMDSPPEELDGLSVFEINFCDMVTAVEN
jgi:hypothetical protein